MEIVLAAAVTGALSIIGILIQRNHKTSMLEHADGKRIWSRIEDKVDSVDHKLDNHLTDHKAKEH